MSFTTMTDNPLLQISSKPNFAPPFSAIQNAHYMPAVEEAIKQARANYEEIKANTDAPTFENTIEAMEGAGELLGQATGIFYNQLSCMGGDELHALAEQIGPVCSNFSSDIILDADLFARVQAVYDQRAELGLTAEQMTVLEESYKDFVRGGALLDEDKKQRLREINEALSTLGPSFMNNAKKSAEAFEMKIDQCIVECGIHMNDTRGDILLLFSFCFCLRLSHCSCPPYFFLPAIGFAGPLRVRAFVRVR